MIHNLILLETINITFSTSSDGFWKTSIPIFAALITGVATICAAKKAVDGVEKTINSNQELKNQELLNSLDQKSEWRKELMNIASKPILRFEDVYRVLASLRFVPKTQEEIEQSNHQQFDEISNYIYCRLLNIITERFKGLETNSILIEKNLNQTLKLKEIEEVRQYAKFLLKHHWEYNKSEYAQEKFKKNEVKEFIKVTEVIENFNDQNFINEKSFNKRYSKEISELEDQYIDKITKKEKKNILIEYNNSIVSYYCVNDLYIVEGKKIILKFEHAKLFELVKLLEKEEINITLLEIEKENILDRYFDNKPIIFKSLKSIYVESISKKYYSVEMHESNNKFI